MPAARLLANSPQRHAVVAGQPQLTSQPSATVRLSQQLGCQPRGPGVQQRKRSSTPIIRFIGSPYSSYFFAPR